MTQVRSNQQAIHQFLTTNGGGHTGSMNAISNYSTTNATGFFIQPRSLETYIINRMHVNVQDIGGLNFVSNYGAIAGGLTNGIIVRTITVTATNLPGTNGTNGAGGSSNLEVRLTGPTNIHVNADWSRYATPTFFGSNATNLNLAWDWHFNPPVSLSGRQTKRLEVYCQDDMSGLLSHTFFVSGLREGIGGTFTRQLGQVVKTNTPPIGNPPPPV